MGMQTLGKLTLTAGGTPQQFNLTQLNCRGFFIQALVANAGAIFIGQKTMVKATLAGCFRIIPQPTTSAATVQPPAWDHSSDVAAPFDLSTFYFDGTTGDSILVAYLV